MWSLLRQPYTVLEPPAVQVRVAGLIGLFVGLFLVVFQPFGLAEWQTSAKWLKISGFGLVSFVLTAVHFTLWPTLFPRFFAEQHWTVGRAIGFVLLNLLQVTFGNFFYLNLFAKLPFTLDNLIWGVLATLGVGVFPVTGVIVGGYIRRLRAYQNLAAQLHPVGVLPKEETSAPQTSPIQTIAEQGFASATLIAENDKDSLTLSPIDLLLIESSDNYCTVYFLKDGRVQKVLLRSSLSRLESQLKPFSRLVRCHRSYVVNLDRVERVTGNAQGYKLHLYGGELEVPVARRYNETLVAGLKGD
ncbi:LytTR family transcriptional regulator [Rudanella paleaurantiibacter]|uniref:LytTR family transcriptional regulator n=1 Tax=Rudanella paleaurantiibacter TaxID=2614655 RepID=A0A7J5U3N7_9BACT|nr:LytTR family DNA-binding domain-containing protein [Rudanella paleaurantiibacter]KAB7732248.1 LytTR family transcriptional regulator [Rudanella paleaurantiibacter]